jgi:hypothetical protein
VQRIWRCMLWCSCALALIAVSACDQFGAYSTTGQISNRSIFTPTRTTTSPLTYTSPDFSFVYPDTWSVKAAPYVGLGASSQQGIRVDVQPTDEPGPTIIEILEIYLNSQSDVNTECAESVNGGPTTMAGLPMLLNDNGVHRWTYVDSHHRSFSLLSFAGTPADLARDELVLSTFAPADRTSGC